MLAARSPLVSLRAVPGAAAAGVLVGLLVGALGAYAQGYALGGWPVGAVLAVVLLACAALSLRLATRTELAVVAAAAGWFTVVTLAGSRRREGDVLVAGDVRGWTFLVGGALALLAVVAAPRRGPLAAR